MAVAAVAVVIVAVAVAAGGTARGTASPARAVSVTAGPVAAVDFQGVPGQLTVGVSRQVISGYIRVGVPQAAGSSRSIAARVTSGELELLS